MQHPCSPHGARSHGGAAALLLTALAAPAHAHGLLNRDFERGDLRDWIARPPSRVSVVRRDGRLRAHQGRWFALLESRTPAETTLLQQEVKLTAGERIRVMSCARERESTPAGEVNGQIVLRQTATGIEWVLRDSRHSGADSAASRRHARPTQVWQRSEVTAPATGEYVLEARVQAVGAAAAVLAIDAVRQDMPLWPLLIAPAAVIPTSSSEPPPGAEPPPPPEVAPEGSAAWLLLAGFLPFASWRLVRRRFGSR